MKRIVSLILALALTLSAIPLFPTPVSAAASWPTLSSSSYCEFTATKTIKCWRNQACTTRGTTSPAKSYNAYISAGDQCKILNITSSCITVAYPTSSGQRTAYIRRSDLIGVSAPSECITSNGKATVYTNTGSTRYGNTAKGDRVYACGTSGNYTLVIYTAKSGSRSFKLGYVKTADYNSIIKKPTSGKQQPIPNGQYTISSALGNNMVVDVNGGSLDNCANVHLWSRNGSGAQQFTVAYNSGGWYTIVNTQSGKALDVANGEGKCGQNVWQYQVNGTNAQKWYLEDAGNGYFYIRSALGFYFDASGGVAQEGTNLQIWDGNRSNAQKFKFESLSGSGSAQYAPYHGLDYTAALNSAYSSGRISRAEYNNRTALLSEAQKMVTVLWTSPVSFHTWKSSGGVYNSNKAMVYGKAPASFSQFVQGYTYQGIPYAANGGHNNYNAESWLALISDTGISKSKLEGTVTYLGITRYKTTFRGVDCSGFVHKAYSTIGSYTITDNERLGTADMVKSSLWKKISASNALPGDILLKNGHVMIYLGKTANNKIAVFESVADGENGTSGCRYYEFDSVSGYGYYRYTHIAG